MSSYEILLPKDAFALVGLGQSNSTLVSSAGEYGDIRTGDQLTLIDEDRKWRTLRAEVKELFEDKPGLTKVVFEVDTSGAVKKWSSGGVIIEDSKVLVISWTTHSYVCFPKGGVESGETSEEAAVREVFEETGYRAKIVAPIGSWTYRYAERGVLREKTADYYLMNLVDPSLKPTPHRELGEDFENLWLDIEKAKEELSLDDAKQVLAKALAVFEEIAQASR